MKRGRYADAVAEIERGRAAAVSGKIALFLLDEGEALAHLGWARVQLQEEPTDPVGAGQSLGRASTLLDDLARRGFDTEAERLRTELLEPLEEQWDDRNTTRRRRDPKGAAQGGRDETASH